MKWMTVVIGRLGCESICEWQVLWAQKTCTPKVAFGCLQFQICPLRWWAVTTTWLNETSHITPNHTGPRWQLANHHSNSVLKTGLFCHLSICFSHTKAEGYWKMDFGVYLRNIFLVLQVMYVNKSHSRVSCRESLPRYAGMFPGSFSFDIYFLAHHSVSPELKCTHLNNVVYLWVTCDTHVDLNLFAIFEYFRRMLSCSGAVSTNMC